MGRRAFRFFVEQTVKRADHIITISNFSRGEIVRNLAVDEKKVSVIHEAGHEANMMGSAMTTSRSIHSPLPTPYIMAFSSLSAHKNIARLIAAFGTISHKVPHSLLLVGHLPENQSVRAGIEKTGSDRVRFTGYLPDDEVQSLLQHASLFAFPSLYEGFGIPILDAQHAGVPVACSAVASLPEVAGEGARLFDPHSTESIADALSACLLDMDLREKLVKKGCENAARFSWEKVARETLAVYAATAS